MKLAAKQHGKGDAGTARCLEFVGDERGGMLRLSDVSVADEGDIAGG